MNISGVSKLGKRRIKTFNAFLDISTRYIVPSIS
jgi:hypothetical protein